MLRSISAFPEELIERFNNGEVAFTFDPAMLLGEDMRNILECLDEQALHAIRTVLMVEYARCAKLPGDAVIKSFNGTSFNTAELSAKRADAALALQKIKETQRDRI